MPPMKIILRTDVDNLGRLGEQVAVKPGYARNYLIPQGMAMPATKANLKQFETERRKLQAKVDAAKAEAEAIEEVLQNCQLLRQPRQGIALLPQQLGEAARFSRPRATAASTSSSRSVSLASTEGAGAAAGGSEVCASKRAMISGVSRVSPRAAARMASNKACRPVSFNK